MEVCRQFLSGKGINVPGEWISACIDFIKSEEINGRNSMNMKWLKEKVYEQWLHSDLMEIGSQCLPNEVSNANSRSKIVEGRFAIQVNQVKDIGLPAYNQLQKLRKNNTENASVTAEKTHQAAWEPKATRMLWMEVTDGTLVCHCMEYRLIPLLSLAMKPGCKIILNGKIECRKGVLLLTRENVTVLGGEVDTMLVEKAQENVLCKKLGIPLTETPVEINEESILSSTINSTQQSQYYPTQSTQGQKSNNFNSSNKMVKQSTIPTLFAKPRVPPTSTNSSRATKPDEFDDFDDDFLDPDVELAITQAEENCQPSTSSNVSRTANAVRPNVQHTNKTTATTYQQRTNNSSDFCGPTTSQPDCDFNDDFNDCDLNFDEDDMEMAMGMDEPDVEYDDFGRPTYGSKLENKVKNETNPINKPTFSGNSITKPENRPTFSGNSITKPENRPTFSGNLITKPENKPTFSGNSISKLENKPSGNSITKPQNKPTFGNSKTKPLNKPSSSLVKNEQASKISKSSSMSTTLPNFSIDDDDFDDDFDLPMEDPPVKNQFDKDKFIHDMKTQPPFTYLCLIDSKLQSLMRYSIKGFILTLLSRLAKNEDGWTLTAKIGDGTKACCVDIHNKVLEKLIGLSVQEMDEQREKSKSDPSIKALRMQRLIDCQKKLIAVSCIFVLEFDPSRERPLLVEFKELLPIHSEQIARR